MSTHRTAAGFEFEIVPSGKTVHAVLRCAGKGCNASAACHATASPDGSFTPNLDALAGSLGFVPAGGGLAACGSGCRDRLADSEKAR